MNIVWIEDFGGMQSSPSGLTTNLFHHLFKAEGLIEFNDWRKTEKPGLPENLFRNWLSEYSDSLGSSHHIKLLTNLQEYQEWIIRDDFDLSRDVDLFVIDINLTNVKYNANTDSIIAEDDVHEKAGLHIYNNLVASGFPKEQVCLMTGEDVTCEDFRKMCALACMTPPKSFHKSINDEDYEPFRAWLMGFAGTDYLRFRRAALNGISWVRRSTSTSGVNAPFHDFFDLRRDHFPFTWKAALGYLDLLVATLPQRPKADNSATLKVFLRALVHEWDNPAQYKVKHPSVLLKRKSPDLYASARTLIQSRNTTVHGPLLDTVSAKDLAVLFIMNFRAMFYEFTYTPIQPYERDLLRMFSNRAGTNIGVSNTLKEVAIKLRIFYSNIIKSGNYYSIEEKKIDPKTKKLYPLSAIWSDPKKNYPDRAYYLYEIVNQLVLAKPFPNQGTSIALPYCSLIIGVFWLSLFDETNNKFDVNLGDPKLCWMAEIHNSVFEHYFVRDIAPSLNYQALSC